MLIRFFENSGYTVTYGIFPGSFKLNLSYNGTKIGIKGHNFEAGIIKGFLNAFGFGGMDVREDKCIMAGDQYCSFSTDSSGIKKYTISSSEVHNAVLSMSRNISREIAFGAGKPGFNGSYLALRNLIIASVNEKGLSPGVSGMAKAVYKSSIHGKEGPAAKAAIEHTISLLNIGKVNVKSLKPLKLELYMDMLASSKGSSAFVKAFVSGLTGEPVGNIAESVAESGNYILRLHAPERN